MVQNPSKKGVVKTNPKNTKEGVKKLPGQSGKLATASRFPPPKKTSTKVASVQSSSNVNKHGGSVKTTTVNNSERVVTGGIIDDIISTGTQVTKTVSELASGNPLGLLDVPNSIMKVIDTTKNVVRSVSNSDTKEKVVLENQKEVKSQGDKVLLDKLKTSMPVITTTQIPSSYSTEISQDPLEVTETVVNGRLITRARGSYALDSCIDDNNPASSRWQYSFRLSPTGPGVFGSRVSSIADIHQLWRIRHIVASWIPTQGTDYVGNYYLNFMDGTDVANHYSGSTTFQEVSQRACAQPGTCNKGANLTFKPVDSNWYYCSNYNSVDPKFFSPATFATLVYNYVPTATANRVGYVLLTFDLEFTSASEGAWNFNQIMRRNFHGIWISRCRLRLNFDTWLSVAWSVLSQLIEAQKALAKSEDKQVRSLIGSSNQDFINAKTRLMKLSERDIKEYRYLEKITFDHLEIMLQSVLDTNRDLQEVLKKLDGDPADLFTPLGFRQLVLMLISFYKDSLILDSSLDFFLRVIRDSLKTCWREYHPMKVELVDPHTSDEEEEDDFEFEDITSE